MLTLALDTSTPAVTAGLADVPESGDITTLVTRSIVDARAHSEQLVPLIQSALDKTGHVSGDLDAIVAGVGPGPFTGLRVGLVTATALGQALAVPVYGVCSLDAIAAETDHDQDRLLVATDARRSEIYWALYDADGQRREGPNVAKPGALPDTAGSLVMSGDGAVRYRDVLDRELVKEPQYPPVSGLIRLAVDRIRGHADSETLTPLYLRRPNVNINGQQQRA